jgi:hypothetical protein
MRDLMKSFALVLAAIAALSVVGQAQPAANTPIQH